MSKKRKESKDELKEKKKKRKKMIRRPLERKTFIITMLLTLGIGTTVLLVGAGIYITSIVYEYSVSAWNKANAEAALIEQTDYRSTCDEILRIYDSLSEEERGDGQSAEYMALYDHTRDENFDRILEAMHSFQRRNGPLNAFLVALDKENERMIYLVDADQNEDSTCRPGTWDTYSEEILESLIVGKEPTKLQKEQGIESNIQAVYTSMEKYGPRITAGATMYETDEYTIMVCVDEILDPLIHTGIDFLKKYLLLLITVTLAASMIGMVLIRMSFVWPLNRLTEAAAAYGSSEDRETGKKHFDDLKIKTGDEIEYLADTLRGMESDLNAYMDNLTQVTAEKERINTELSLAARIQMGMLNVNFPAFPEKKEFDIYASMEPAKEVGGDFYDMLMIDEDHVAILIADVSGKGVPAALFMMASKIMLADRARSSSSPAEVLERVNRKICAKNEEEMFVTVWLGILEISTGIMKAANAGHEYPVLVHADGSAELIKDKHGFVIGGMDGMKYEDYELHLGRGDKIFVYTDGVTEATNADDELFGTERMLEAAGSAGAGAGPDRVMQTVRGAISEFIGDAEQFDDLTMLCLEYRGKDELS